MSNKESSLTWLLDQAAAGNRQAANDVFGIVYQELWRIAEIQFAREDAAITLQPTALVHEVWLKLLGSESPPAWTNRRHFFAAAALGMRRILVDAARARKRQKRGGQRVQIQLNEDLVGDQQDEELLALDEALENLRTSHPRQAELVVLRYFGGLTIAQAAESLGISEATAERDWTFARAWLRTRLANE